MKSSKSKRAAAQPVAYEADHFTRGIASSTFLVGWKPDDPPPSTARSSADARRGVERGKAFGGFITMGMPGTPKTPKPGRM